MGILKTGQIIELRIDRLATGGFGVGRFEGMVVFVPLSAPGDLLKVAITEVKKNFSYGRTLETIAASPDRVTPQCPHFGTCGGCNWQHISYAEQLNQKFQILKWIFKNFECPIEPILPSPREWNYRRRVQLHQKNDRIGFLKRNSHEIVEVKTCPIARPELLAAWPQECDPQLGEKFELGLGEEGQVYKTSLKDSFPEFSQVNIEQNETLKSLVVGMAKKLNTEKLYDLYSGSGNFAFDLAQKIKGLEIVGIDADQRLVDQANARATKSGLRNLTFSCQTDASFSPRESFAGCAVVLDPPRAGCSRQLIGKLIEDRPKAIIYVSCHPQTAERDMRLLAKGFHLDTLVPLDMFPQTDHIEIVGLLR